MLPGPGACLSLAHTHFAVCAGRGSRSRVPGQDVRREGEGTGYGVDDRPVDTLQKQRKINWNCCNRSIQNERNAMEEGQHWTVHHLQQKKTTTHKGKVVEARFKINGKGFHTRGSGHVKGHTKQRCTPVSMPIQKESEQAPGTWTCWELLSRHSHKKFQTHPSWTKSKLGKALRRSTIHACPVVQLRMTSLYGQCWEKDTRAEPSEPIWTFLQPG